MSVCIVDSMDPETIQQRLAQAERHATEGRRLVARQEDLMANFAGQGFETTEAQRVLERSCIRWHCTKPRCGAFVTN